MERRGQFWSKPAEEEKCQVQEILGFTDGAVDVATWDCLSDPMVSVSSTLHAVSGLAGSRSRTPLAHDLLGRGSKLVHVTRDSFSKRGRRVARVIAMGDKSPQPPIMSYKVAAPAALTGLVSNASRVYTDRKDFF